MRNTTETEKDAFTFLNYLRVLGTTNMYGAVPYIVENCGVEKREAQTLLSLWMKNFNAEGDYDQIKEEG